MAMCVSRNFALLLAPQHNVFVRSESLSENAKYANIREAVYIAKRCSNVQCRTIRSGKVTRKSQFACSLADEVISDKRAVCVGRKMRIRKRENCRHLHAMSVCECRVYVHVSRIERINLEPSRSVYE